jgi:hypothetical protein
LRVRKRREREDEGEREKELHSCSIKALSAPVAEASAAERVRWPLFTLLIIAVNAVSVSAGAGDSQPRA